MRCELTKMSSTRRWAHEWRMKITHGMPLRTACQPCIQWLIKSFKQVNQINPRDLICHTNLYRWTWSDRFADLIDWTIGVANIFDFWQVWLTVYSPQIVPWSHLCHIEYLWWLPSKFRTKCEAWSSHQSLYAPKWKETVLLDMSSQDGGFVSGHEGSERSERFNGAISGATCLRRYRVLKLKFYNRTSAS